MFAGRKLLVADDSPYYRTVISLTFTDEGMEVTTAGDSYEALEKLEQSIPDVILANVSMPGPGGYELCELIKQSERFGHIPVMLLVGLHEPFDQAEARRVGADDVVTKPFKSIRQLVNRVGSLLGGKAVDAEGTSHEYSTLGLDRSDANQPPAPDDQIVADTNVTVFVEAAAMSEPEHLEPAAPDNQILADSNVTVFVEAAAMTEPEPIEAAVEAAGTTCVADVELQTADTQQLERIDDEPAGETIEPIPYAQDDTIEMEPAIAVDEKLNSPTDVGPDEHMSSIGAPEMNEEPGPQAAPLQTQGVFKDALLDLGDFDRATKFAGSDDLVLDLDYEVPASAPAVTVLETVPEPVAAVEAVWPAESTAPGPAYEEQPVVIAELHQWSIVTEAPAAEAMPASVVEDQGPTEPNLGLSPEAIDAIARRVVDQMSEKVVREIAWEVVPELAELLIKKKLDEQSH